jgi:alpha-L-fucosidase
MKIKFAFLLCIIASTLFSQSIIVPDTTGKLKWFTDAKLGIFLHYGIYAVNGIAESWSFHENQISYEDYMKQLDGFTAKNYHPEEWAKLFKEAGAKYAVMTAKHHDGVALWDTKLSDLSVVKKSPAKRDLMKPYAEALRKEGLKVGVYFSHLDWSNPDYATIYYGNDTVPKKKSHYDFPQDGKTYPYRWQKFVKFRNGQCIELAQLINPDLWWFDGDADRTREQWGTEKFKDTLLSYNPKAIFNSRLNGLGDYLTPEQGIPIFGHTEPWELCMTVNNSWGYQKHDHNQKPVNYIIKIFTDIISLGGNLLLDVGPMEDGTITPEQTEILKSLGRWTKKHAEAIYETERGLPFGYFEGATTLSKNKKTIYCFIQYDPINGVYIKGIKNKITGVRLIGTNEKLDYKMIGANFAKIPGLLQISIPKDKLDKDMTVFAVDLDSPLELHSDKK